MLMGTIGLYISDLRYQAQAQLIISAAKQEAHGDIQYRLEHDTDFLKVFVDMVKLLSAGLIPS